MTSLFAVREGEHWRVQIVWPNGIVHYFGKYTSKQNALDWIAAHGWLTIAAKNYPEAESNESYPQSPSASLFTAGAFGLLTLIQCRDRPDR